MYVKNRITKHPICIDVNSKISDVVDIMSEKELHRIPVISGKKLVGLVTELSLIHILKKSKNRSEHCCFPHLTIS